MVKEKKCLANSIITILCMYERQRKRDRERGSESVYYVLTLLSDLTKGGNYPLLLTFGFYDLLKKWQKRENNC